jgi:capsular polysaccharide export protein
MGRTFYNIPGLTDQKPLDHFWLDPQSSDRGLFYRFYDHLVRTTQVNGNFDADFPFRTTFPIGPGLDGLAPTPRLPDAAPPRREAIGLLPARLLSRLGWSALIFVVYGLQLVALALRCFRLASLLLRWAAAAALRALGVRVVVDDSQPSEPAGVPLVHLWNHESPIDVLVVQAVLRIPSITTADLHLSRVLPWFGASARNAGHGLMDHRDRRSRRQAYFQASRTLLERGEVMLAPNGSLVTPISERVSASALLLARRHHALIVPWTFLYEGLPPAGERRYKPLRLLCSRLTAPPATIYCRRGRARDLPLPAGPDDRQRFTAAVQAYYATGPAIRRQEPS